MIGLWDTDITLKLAACDCLPATLAVLGLAKNDVYVFREEAYRVYAHNAEVIADYSVEARKRALKFINDAHRVDVEIDAEEQFFMNMEDIDPGEQVLFGATRSYSDFRLLMADRKALRLLTVANGCGGICARLQGRVICLEQILLLLIPHLGYDDLRARVTLYASVDAAFDAPFQGTRQEAETLLRERIFVLRSRTRDLLIP